MSLQVPEIGDASRDHSYRHSLQPKGVSEGPILRHTQSQNFDAKKKKVVKVVKVPPPPIPEVKEEPEVQVEIVNEQAKEKKLRKSKGSRRSSQSSSRLGIDNAAFEVEDGLKISRGNSRGNSGGNSGASSVRSSVRNPSVKSLTVVREQYCCRARWTPCERTLFAAVGVLTCIIIILVIVVAIIATKDSSNSSKKKNNIFQIFDTSKF